MEGSTLTSRSPTKGVGHRYQHQAEFTPELDHEFSTSRYQRDKRHSSSNSISLQQPNDQRQYSGAVYPDMHGSNSLGLGIYYDDYPAITETKHEVARSTSVRNQNFHGPKSPSTPRATPRMTPVLSPKTSFFHDTSRVIRGVKEFPNAESSGANTKSRIAKTPKSRKPKGSRADNKNRMPKLEEPLSVLTKDLNYIPIRDMEAWVNRSIEDRHKEVEGRDGYITRPMNSFMLYRSAYAERTKMWCLQNNHQVVSAVSGESWPLEPPEIRDRYNKLAKIERENHQKAHPDYKFSPSKTGQAAKKKKDEFSEDEGSVMSDHGADWTASGHKKHTVSGKRRSQSPEMSKSLSTTLTPHTNSIYAKNFLHKQHPTPYINSDLFHYYRTQQANQDFQDYQNQRARLLSYAAEDPLIGLPGGQHTGLFQQDGIQNVSLDQNEIDPLLNNYQSTADNDWLAQHLWRQQFSHPQYTMQEADLAFETLQAYNTDPSMADLNWASFSAGYNGSSIGPSTEFDKWMEEYNSGERR